MEAIVLNDQCSVDEEKREIRGSIAVLEPNQSVSLAWSGRGKAECGVATAKRTAQGIAQPRRMVGQRIPQALPNTGDGVAVGLPYPIARRGAGTA